MAFQTSAGLVVAISAGLPATNDAAGFAALTYSTVSGVSSVSAFGKTYNEVTFNPLNDRKTLKFKGSYDNGTISMEVAVDDADAGQVIVRSALDSDNNYSFKLTRQDGSVRYFFGRVMSFPENPGSVDSMYMATCDVSINSDVVKVAA